MVLSHKLLVVGGSMWDSIRDHAAFIHFLRASHSFAAFFLDQSSTSIFAPQATPAHSIFGLSMLVLAICGAIFLVVAGFLLYTLIRYRHRRGDTDREPAQIYGSNQIELSWTVIPILIVVVLFLATARVIFATQSMRPSRGRARCRGDRPSVLVGVSLSETRHRHRQRTARSGQRSRAPDADLSDHVVRGYRP